MNKPFRNILVNATTAFVAAFLITTFFHEFGHFISYRIFGFDATLFHNYVYTPAQEIGRTARIVSLMAGPLFSLLQGIFFAALISSKRKRRPIHLLFLWLSLLGFINFFGYLMMTPLFAVGDTGKVAEILQLDALYRIMIAVIGLVVLIYLILKTARHFSDFIPEGIEKSRKEQYVYRIMFFPIIIGSIMNTVLAFPAPVLLSIIYPATSAYMIMISFRIILKTPGADSERSEIEKRISRPVLSVFIVALLLNRLLTLGLG
jgi:hypothetical protein